MSAIGYPDFRRQTDFDTNPNLSDQPALPRLVTPLDFGPFNVANFGYLGGVLYLGTTPAEVFFSFWADQAMTVPVGEKHVFMDPTNGGVAQIRLGILGRWVLMRIITGGVTPFTWGHNIFGSNRGGFSELIPPAGTILESGLIAVGGGLSVTTHSGSMGSGHGRLIAVTGANPGTFILGAMDTSFAYQEIGRVTLAANSGGALDVILPPAPVQVTTINTGAGAANYTTRLIVSGSGN